MSQLPTTDVFQAVVYFTAGLGTKLPSVLLTAAAPEYVRIVNRRGRILDTVAGTFSEGDRLELTCRVKGGKRRPSVLRLKSLSYTLRTPSSYVPAGHYPTTVATRAPNHG